MHGVAADLIEPGIAAATCVTEPVAEKRRQAVCAASQVCCRQSSASAAWRQRATQIATARRQIDRSSAEMRLQTRRVGRFAADARHFLLMG